VLLIKAIIIIIIIIPKPPQTPVPQGLQLRFLIMHHSPIAVCTTMVGEELSRSRVGVGDLGSAMASLQQQQPLVVMSGGQQQHQQHQQQQCGSATNSSQNATSTHGIITTNLHHNNNTTTRASDGFGKMDNPAVDEFPAGLRVLVVDDDPICLMILDRMLRQCSYQGLFFHASTLLFMCWLACIFYIRLKFPICDGSRSSGPHTYLQTKMKV
jgi:hypothetical protein